MKIKINDKYEDVSFLSFFKGYILSWALLTVIAFTIFFFIGVFIA